MLLLPTCQKLFEPHAQTEPSDFNPYAEFGPYGAATIDVYVEAGVIVVAVTVVDHALDPRLLTALT